MTSRLLVIDSDVDFISVVGPRLTAFGFAVRHAPTTEAAELIIKDNPPDLVLLDVSHSNYADALDWLLRRETHLRFIVLSSVTDMKVITLAIETGALDYIVKPCELPRLVGKIHNALAVTI